MSSAIIRNAKYKRENLMAVYRHNERKNKHYSNKDIDKTKSYLNYSLKEPKFNYVKDFDKIIEEYDLKGQLKTVSNIVCEYMITSDNDFFKRIGEKETKRYFEIAYKFVCEYKDLGENYILSAKVHYDEKSPHMHLLFLPVVHTTDKKGNPIDKLACSEFWKAKDSYRQLQNAFFEYMLANGFKLQRGLPREKTNRLHYTLKEYKNITNFEQTKETLENIKLELPDVLEIADIKVNRLSKKRDEKILEKIIKPKDDLIQTLYQDNMNLHRELSRQSKVIENAEKYQEERDTIIADNKALNNKVQYLEKEYKRKSNNLDFDYNNRKYELEKKFKEKEFDIEYKYKRTIHKLAKENRHLHKVVDKLKTTIEKFIKWICKKFDLPSEDAIIRDFEKETYTFIDAEKQIKHEKNMNKDYELDR